MPGSPKVLLFILSVNKVVFKGLSHTTHLVCFQNFCTNSTVLRTRTTCHSCTISMWMPCPSGYKKTPKSSAQDCSYYIRTQRLKLAISGCSFECYKETEVTSCCPGFWGQDCIGDVCLCLFICVSVCVCLCIYAWCIQVGFAGTACEVCVSGRYGPTCSSECSCVHGLCDSGLKGSGSCTCFSGYKGSNCDQELPECAALSCPQYSRCMEEALTGQLVCQCLPGYQKSGQQCLSINPCLQQVCHAQASCVHTGPNQHLCVCNEGYSGDGRVCMAINPCQTKHGGCSQESTRCIYDRPGKSYCECIPGFERLLNGSCSMKESCTPDSCHKNAKCSTVGPGEVECTCLEGYIGSGKVCYGNIIQRLNELNTDPGGQLTGQLSNAITLFGSLSWPLQNLGPFTVFVPINKGFRGTPVRTLTADSSKAKYLCKMHLVAGVMPFDTLKKSDIFYTLTGKSAEIDTSEGTKIRIHGSKKKGMVIQSDIVASNGMIHIINKLMDSVSPTVESDTQENIMKIISDYGKFDKFKSLLQKVGLASIMDLSGPMTVFAPDNSAFDAMTEGHLQYLIFVFFYQGQILVDGKAVLEAAVETKNGLLYVVDGVLTPSSIVPVLPHRCDISETKIVKVCSKGSHGSFTFGCIYTLSLGKPLSRVPATGCSRLCNVTVTTPACCQGFYGPDCSPCPGGHQMPCSQHGQCLDGIGGNGSCICDSNFSGSRCQYCSSSNKYGPNCDRTCPCIHGQCDNRPDSDGRCKPDSCLTGFTGPFCDHQTAACGARVQFCHAHADCDFSQGTPRCVCKPGYQGDGITCVESDPCVPPHRGGCSVNAKCIKTGPGSHSCQCLAGWREDGDECQPINNCNGPDGGGCHPNATCIYVGPGQSDCMCKAGYKGNGQDCEAVNQCVTADGGCHYLASCRLLSSKWTCVCDEGYVGNGQTCYGTVQQELMTLPDASEFSAWTTYSLSQFLSHQNVTLLVPSSAAMEKMSSEERSFWTTKGNLPSLVRNHIIPGNFPLSSLSNISSLTSLLKTTFPVSTSTTVTVANIAATNGLIHVIDKVLVPDRKMSEGLLATLALRPEFSLFRSYLIDYNLTDEIEQAGEFTVFAPTDTAITFYLKEMAATALDVNTTQYHVVTSERLLKTDLQPGGYKQTMLGFSFQLGIFPRDGKLFVNDAQINSSNILSGNGVIHGLSAVLHITRNRCDETEYNKFMGSCVDCLFPQSEICPNAMKSVKKRKCMFSQMFEGERLLTIGCRSTCLQEIIVRKCCGGFFGEHCEPCPGPVGQACFGNGLCLDGTNGTGGCQCSKGFYGTACETCLTGKYGVHCDQECKCKNGQCNEGITGDGTCECNIGWRGVLCDESNPSHSHRSTPSAPTNLSSHHLKNKSPTGNGTFCQARDLCLQNNGGCSVNAVCKRTLPGRRDCVCRSGFSGDGLVCVEINPCLGGSQSCHVDAECVHVGPNKTSCVCREGYSGNGQNCEIINLCLKKNGGCNTYARCNMTGPGVRTCTCRTNYIGNGLTCREQTNFCKTLQFADISLKGRGPFTVFLMTEKNLSKEQFAAVLRSHIVICHTLLPADLSRPRNLTSLSGRVLTTSSSQGNIFINQANVTYSDGVSINGIFHVIDKILFVPDTGKTKEPDVPLNLTDVAERHGYKTFYKLLEDTGVMDLLNDGLYQPVTIFLPSDGVMASLPQEQKDFLFHKDNRQQLVEYLKYHILLVQKVYADTLVHMDSARTLQGSPLSFSCGGMDNIGEIFVNNGKCQIVQRHLIFNGGIAYGIDCLLTPPSLGGRCDKQMTFQLTMGCGTCTSSASQCPGDSRLKEIEKCDLPSLFVTRNSGCRKICTVNIWQPQCCHSYYGRDCLVCPGGVGSTCSNHGKCDDGHLGNGTCTCDAGFEGMACEKCSDGFYGASCKACNCSENGSCDSGRRGTGACFCDVGWTGERCETQLGVWNGGCAQIATCSQKGDKVSCTCPKGHSGDGFTCQPIDLCASGDNGGCHKHATCTMTAPGKKKCSCKDKYMGDGISCELKQLPISRCLQDNGRCHQDAKCTDLHFEDAKLGVFHYRSDKGQYKLNYTDAQRACTAQGASLATYTQLSYAQQGGLNMCSASWLDQVRVAYPTTYSNSLCGFGHVGIVDYGTRKNLSETWDAFCYRMKEVKCECQPGYVGDGFSCTGNLMQVLQSTPTFSNFLTQILNYSLSEDGERFVKRLSNLAVRSTLFVPDNNGLPDNQTLSQRDIEFHLSEGQALPVSQLKNGSRIQTRVGGLSVLGVANLLNPSSSCYINNRFITDSDILASNGIIHVLQGPLKAPPPHQEAGMGVGLVLLIVVVAGVVFVGYHFYTHNSQPFQFHYFKEEEEEESPPVHCSHSICNPVYEAEPETAEHNASEATVSQFHSQVRTI
uniref:Uncharacterized protein n=1 Tax=Mola mola TaxID=94237 RepID=A0A3Q3W761_MOLML